MQTKKQINNQEVKLPKGKISISSRTMTCHIRPY
jgi:hypothetical protein